MSIPRLALALLVCALCVLAFGFVPGGPRPSPRTVRIVGADRGAFGGSGGRSRLALKENDGERVKGKTQRMLEEAARLRAEAAEMEQRERRVLDTAKRAEESAAARARAEAGGEESWSDTVAESIQAESMGVESIGASPYGEFAAPYTRASLRERRLNASVVVERPPDRVDNSSVLVSRSELSSAKKLVDQITGMGGSKIKVVKGGEEDDEAVFVSSLDELFRKANAAKGDEGDDEDEEVELGMEEIEMALKKRSSNPLERSVDVSSNRYVWNPASEDFDVVEEEEEDQGDWGRMVLAPSQVAAEAMVLASMRKAAFQQMTPAWLRWGFVLLVSGAAGEHMRGLAPQEYFYQPAGLGGEGVEEGVEGVEEGGYEGLRELEKQLYEVSFALEVCELLRAVSDFEEGGEAVDMQATVQASVFRDFETFDAAVISRKAQLRGSASASASSVEEEELRQRIQSIEQEVALQQQRNTLLRAALLGPAPIPDTPDSLAQIPTQIQIQAPRQTQSSALSASERAQALQLLDKSDIFCARLLPLLRPGASKDSVDTAEQLMLALREGALPEAEAEAEAVTPAAVTATVADAAPLAATAAAEAVETPGRARGGLGALLRRVGLGRKEEGEGEGGVDLDLEIDEGDGGMQALSDEIRAVSETLNGMIQVSENGTTTIRMPLNSTLGTLPSLLPPPTATATGATGARARARAKVGAGEEGKGKTRVRVRLDFEEALGKGSGAGGGVNGTGGSEIDRFMAQLEEALVGYETEGNEEPATTSEQLIAEYFDAPSRSTGPAISRSGAGRFQNEVLKGVMTVSSVKLSQGAVIFESGKIRDTNKLALELEQRYTSSGLSEEVDYLLVMNERIPNLNQSPTQLALESMVGASPAIIVFPKSWNTTVTAVVTDPVKKFWRQTVSSVAVATTLIYAAARVGTFDPTGEFMTSSEVLQVSEYLLPMALSSALIQNAASFAEFWVAKAKGVQINSVFMPSVGELLFSFGQRSTYLSPPKNRSDMFDIAFAGVATALGLSLAAVYAGMALGAGAEREVAAGFPTIPMSLLQVNTFVSQLFLAQFGDLYQAGSDMAQATADVPAQLHWLTVVGITSFIANTLQLVPGDNSAGSKLSYATLGREYGGLVSALAGVFKSIFFGLMIFNVGGFTNSPLLTKPKVLLDYFIVSQLVNNEFEVQLAKDNLTSVSDGRKSLYYLLLGLLLLSFFPYQAFVSGVSEELLGGVEFLKGLISRGGVQQTTFLP